MIARFKARLRERRLTKLAQATLAETLRLYESGEFGWIVGEEFQDESHYHLTNPKGFLVIPEEVPAYDSMTRDYESLGVQRVDGFGEYGVVVAKPVNGDKRIERAAFGCALGGLSKAAWLVTGKPAPGTDAWRDKVMAEVEAQMILSTAILERKGQLDNHRLSDGTLNPNLGIITGRNDSDGKEAILNDLRHALGQPKSV